MAVTLKKHNVEGRTLTYTEVDGNWTAIENALNKNFTVTQSLITGANTINHAKGVKPIGVIFFSSTGVPLQFDWKRDPADPTNKIIVTLPSGVPSGDKTNVEINIQFL